MRRLRFWLAYVVLRRPARYFYWLIVFWLVQIWTLHRPVCAQLVDHRVSAHPVGACHIHWCGVCESDDHGVHRCHGCGIQWYDCSITSQKLYADEQGGPANGSDEGYGFTIYPFAA